MTNETRQENVLDWEEKDNKLPSMLNVLTILTIIGCVLAFCTSVYSYWQAPKAYEQMSVTLSKMENAPDFAKKMMGPDPMEMTRRSLDNRLPILILGLAGTGLCLYGALQMRKRKKNGFYIYLIGELLLPTVALAIFMGFDVLSSFTLVMTFLFPVLFFILYATQLKHMK